MTDEHGNPLADVSVSFTLELGEGSVTGSPATTNASGIATAGSWTVGTTAVNIVFAKVGSMEPVSFDASGVAKAAADWVKHSGDGQSAAVGAAVPQGPAVRVTDAHGNLSTIQPTTLCAKVS